MADISTITLPDGNTYSLKDNQARETLEAITNEKFAVLTGVLPSSTGYSERVELPSGFTVDNCVITSFMVYAGSSWRGGVGMFAGSERLFIDMRSNGISVYGNQSSAYGHAWKIVLMRTDM